jgi:hypothetical protein
MELAIMEKGAAVGYPIERFRALDTPTLRSELSRILTLSADHLAYMAAIWQELEARGENLSELKTGLGVYLPLIAARKLDAEVVVKFAGNKTLINAMVSLPIDEQRRLAHGGTVAVIDEHGTTKNVPIIQLRGRQIKMVIDAGRIRPPEEQTDIATKAKKPKMTNASTYLGAEEYEALKTNAASRGLNISKIIHDTLIAAGLLTKKEKI